MFFKQIVETFLVLTIPDSSIAKPAAIHITRKPIIKNNNVLKTNAVSSGLLDADALHVKNKVAEPKTKNNKKFLNFDVIILISSKE